MDGKSPLFGVSPSLGGFVKSTQGVIDEANTMQKALIRKNSDARPRLQWRVVLALDTASTAGNPGFLTTEPFDGYYVESATDSTTSAKMCLVDRTDAMATNYTTIQQKDSSQFSEPVRGCMILWSAQSGKTITIVFYLGLRFLPGSYLTSITGGVFEQYGTVMTPSACVAVTASLAPATTILAANTSRKKATLTNISGGTVWISGTTTVVGGAGAVAATSLVGIPIPPGGSYEWINTGAIYGCTDAGTSLIAINQES